jgi:glutathione S-transferase
MYHGQYALIGTELSFFTRKLEAQLRFQQIPWQWNYKTLARSAEIEARTGTHFIPALATPEKWLIHDTIALGPLLNDRFAEQPVIPDTPLQRTCCFILEDAFNHWLGRTAVHTRWCYPDNVAWIGPRFAANAMLDRSIDVPFSEQELDDFATFADTIYQEFGKNACAFLGCPPEQEQAMRADFTLMLDALNTHFTANKFLLGDRPCLADFALAGASKAHFITDPEAVSWLGEYHGMLRKYTDQFFVDKPNNTGQWLADDEVPETLTVVFDYIQRSYLQYAIPNIAAGRAGEKYFEYNYGFGPTTARTQRRLNLARQHVGDELHRVGAETHKGIGKLFAGRGILEHYLAQ